MTELRAVSNAYEHKFRALFEEQFSKTEWYIKFKSYTMGEGNILRWTANGYLHPVVDQGYSDYKSSVMAKFVVLEDEGLFKVGKWLMSDEGVIFLTAGEFEDIAEAVKMADEYEKDDQLLDSQF